MTVQCAAGAATARVSWGTASTGAVGDDEEPVQVPSIELGGEPRARVVQIDAGDAHTCVLLDTGVVRCWGAGGDGRLGQGDTRSIGDDEHPASAADIDLGGWAVAIAVGSMHSCAMLEDMNVMCWGSGQDGRLGLGNIDSVGDDEVPAAVGPVPTW